MKVKDLLKSGFEFLDQRQNALIDCELILSNVFGVNKEYLISHSDEEIGGKSSFADDLIKLFWFYLKRLKAGEPLAYIIRQKEFYGLDFYVDERVLIPRPETELLVERVLKHLKSDFLKFSRRRKVLDVGTGSGNIAVVLAANFQNLDVMALDLSEKALEVARINVEQHGVEDRVELCQSDLLEVLEDGEKFDVIVANLPYIGVIRNNDVEENVKKYEPSQALFAGNNGLELYKKMFQHIFDKCIKCGMIVGEIGSMQRKDLELLLNKYFEQNWRIEKDLAGKDRIFVVGP